MAPELRIQMLGPFAAVLDGRALTWRSRQERRLLLMLLAARGSDLPTETIIERLWPDAAPQTAGVSLRSAMSSLRRTLEPDLPPRAPSRYILTRPTGYAWQMGSGWIDADAFDHLLPASPRKLWTTERLDAALALYYGDVLSDEPDAPWIIHERERLHLRWLDALAARAEYHLSSSQPDAAATLARRGLDADPLHEPLVRTLMQAQARQGNTPAALLTYETYRDALDATLGADPAPATRQLHQSIVQGAVLPVALPAAPALIARERELTLVRGWLAAALAGHGTTVVVQGEAGIGKTRLAETVARLAAPETLLLTARASLLERDIPLGATGESLRPLLLGQPDAVLRRLPTAALAALADLLPALRERRPLPALPAVPPAEQRNRLLDALVDLALAVAIRRPLLLTLDDAQWADDATLALLGRLARHAPNHRMLLLLTVRSDEQADSPRLLELLRLLGRERLLHTLTLRRFAEAEVGQFLADLAQVPVEAVAPLAGPLTSQTGGNPLFLTVAVQALLEDRHAATLAEALATAGPLPDLAQTPTVRDVVLARAARLPTPARDLLDVLALLGRPASLDLIEELGGALDDASLLLERQFLAEQPDGRLGFGHELIRSTIAARLSIPRQRVLHRAIASALHQLYPDAPERAAERLLHLRASGRGAAAAVVQAGIAAGEHARRTFAYGQALDAYAAAIAAAETLPDLPAEQMWRAATGLLFTNETLLDWQGVTATVAAYGRWAHRRADAPPALVAPQRLVLLRALTGDIAGAMHIALEAGAMGQQAVVNAPLVQDMLWRTALLLHPPDDAPAPAHLPPPPAPEPPPGEPVADAVALLGPSEAALTLFQIGWATLSQGLVSSARPCLLRAYELALETSQVGVAVISAVQLEHLHTHTGDTAAAAQWLDQSLMLAERAEEAAWAILWPRIHQAFLWLLDDRLELAAHRFASMDAQLADLPAFEAHRASVWAGRGLTALAQGDTTSAGPLIGAALQSQHVYGFVRVAALLGKARLAAIQGDLHSARATLASAIHYAAQRHLLPEYVRSIIELVRIERDFGDPASVVGALGPAARAAEQIGLTTLASAARRLEEKIVAQAAHR